MIRLQLVAKQIQLGSEGWQVQPFFLIPLLWIFWYLIAISFHYKSSAISASASIFPQDCKDRPRGRESHRSYEGAEGRFLLSSHDDHVIS